MGVQAPGKGIDWINKSNAESETKAWTAAYDALLPQLRQRLLMDDSIYKQYSPRYSNIQSKNYFTQS